MSKNKFKSRWIIYIDSPASIDSIDSQKRSNNVTISLNVLYAKKEKKLHPAYVSKDNSDHEKLVIYLMTPNGEGWHYVAVKKLSAL